MILFILYLLMKTYFCCSVGVLLSIGCLYTEDLTEEMTGSDPASNV